MTIHTKLLSLFFAAALVSPLAVANDVEGEIESLDREEKTFEVQGITFHASEDTRFDDDLKSFDDLEEGQTVEVDFEYRDGRHYATEIEKEKKR